jgi:hypothetical protein
VSASEGGIHELVDISSLGDKPVASLCCDAWVCLDSSLCLDASWCFDASRFDPQNRGMDEDREAAEMRTHG